MSPVCVFLQTPKKWNHTLWHGLPLTGSPSLQAHNLTCEDNKGIPTYINLIPVVLSSTRFLLIGMQRSELDNSRTKTSHHQSLVLYVYSRHWKFLSEADDKISLENASTDHRTQQSLLQSLEQCLILGQTRLKAHIHNTWKKFHSSYTAHSFKLTFLFCGSWNILSCSNCALDVDRSCVPAL